MKETAPTSLQSVWQGYLLVPASLVVLILIAFQSFRISNQYGGTDLRARVVGARLLFSEHSPYFYTWRPGDPETLMDPNIQPGRKVNGNVVTPAVLWLMQPLVWLPYKSIRPVWTLLELFSALLTIYWLSGMKSLKQLAGFFLLPALLLLAGPYWNFHTDRGQMYIFYTALVAGSWFIYKKGKNGKFWSGFLAGLLVFMRPFAICFALPFLAVQQREWIKGFALAILTGILLWVLPMQNTWKDYAAAMKIFSAEITGSVAKENASPIAFPAEVEQMKNLGDYGQYPLNAFPTTFEISKKLNFALPQWASYGLLALFMLMLTTLLIRKRILAPEKLFMCGFVLMMACEYTTHAPRAPYNLLMWLAPVCLLLASPRGEHFRSKWWMAGILFLLLHPAFTFQNSFGYAGEALLLGLAIAFILAKKKERI